jgi:hypothetical protein
MMWGGHAACIEEMRNAQFYSENLKEIDHLLRPRRITWDHFKPKS